MSSNSNSESLNEVFKYFLSKRENTFIKELDCDPSGTTYFPNRNTRPVYKGHYVIVEPKPLLEPYLVSWSKELADELGLTESVLHSEDFLKLFSADCNLSFERVVAWCTPYAVSVFGEEILSPDAFHGYAYGDGRAASVGEFPTVKVNASNNQDSYDFVTKRCPDKYELQLKGSGPTPFSRNFDGRAVLRSSIREFLVSEAMHHLGVPTTRALCLVASKSEFVERAWFKSDTYSEQYNFPPNFMIKERCAITTRAASSFLRVGQIELFSRKVRNGDEGALEEMKKFLMYCFKREFPDLYEHESQDMKPQQLAQQTIKFLKLFSKRQAALVAAWLRVGYVQGNMNSDNCLLAGITMDYGPFGFVEKYDPLWTPFTSDPQQNFGFERQLLASYVNFATLTKALMPIFEDSREMIDELQDVLQNDCKRDLLEARDLMRQRKLGLSDWSDAANQNLWSPLYEILPGMDYIIFWRELSQISLKTLQTFTEEEVARIFGRAAYDLDLFYAEKKKKLYNWIKRYADFVENEKDDNQRLINMKLNNPKYIPREWMLVEAYESADKNNFEPLRQLQELFKTPYEEHSNLQEKFYIKTPVKFRRKAGVSFFSCSS